MFTFCGSVDEIAFNDVTSVKKKTSDYVSGRKTNKQKQNTKRQDSGRRLSPSVTLGGEKPPEEGSVDPLRKGRAWQRFSAWTYARRKETWITLTPIARKWRRAERAERAAVLWPATLIAEAAEFFVGEQRQRRLCGRKSREQRRTDRRSSERSRRRGSPCERSHTRDRRELFAVVGSFPLENPPSAHVAKLWAAQCNCFINFRPPVLYSACANNTTNPRMLS